MRLLVTNQVCNVLKLKLFSHVDAYACPKLIGPCECVKDNTYAKLIVLLESIHVVDRSFQKNFY